MPIHNYHCSNQHSFQVITQSVSQVLDCIPCEKPRCKRIAVRDTVARVGFMKMTYGASYGYATESDRKAWLKNLHIRGWTGPDSQPIKYPKPGRRRVRKQTQASARRG